MKSTYPKLWRLDAPEASQLFDGPVTIEDKVEGWPISVKMENNKLVFNPKAIPAKAAEMIDIFQDRLVPGWTYYMVDNPDRGLVLIDVEREMKHDYAGWSQRNMIAGNLEIEPVRVYGEGKGTRHDIDEIMDDNGIKSVVVKNYERYNKDGSILMGKVER